MSAFQSNATTTRGAADSPDTRARLPIFAVAQQPFAHVECREFLRPELFCRLAQSFPQCPASSGPTGFSLYPTDVSYRRLLRTNTAWRSLYEMFHCQSFIDWARAQFVLQWRRGGCRIDLDEARYVDYQEDRVDKERTSLRQVRHAAEQLWVRMDIYQGHVGYSRRIHCDHARRLLTLLIYFSDHDQDGMAGGELLLHAPPSRRWFQRPTVLPPRANAMIAFPCSDRSFHSVAKITSSRHPRNYIQVQISSSVDIWPRGRPQQLPSPALAQNGPCVG